MTVSSIFRRFIMLPARLCINLFFGGSFPKEFSLRKWQKSILLYKGCFFNTGQLTARVRDNLIGRHMNNNRAVHSSILKMSIDVFLNRSH